MTCNSLSLYLLHKLSRIWALGALSSWLLCSFQTLPSLSEYFFTFWHSKISQAHLVLSLTRPAAWSFEQIIVARSAPASYHLMAVREKNPYCGFKALLPSQAQSLPLSCPAHLHSSYTGILTVPRTCPTTVTSGPLHGWLFVILQLSLYVTSTERIPWCLSTEKYSYHPQVTHHPTTHPPFPSTWCNLCWVCLKTCIVEIFSLFLAF